MLAVSKISTVSSGAPPLPDRLSLAEVESLGRVGQLVVTEGPVVEVGSNFGGAYMRMGTHPGSFKVFLPSAQGGHKDFTGFAIGEIVRVTGIAYQYCPQPPYNNQFELLIGDVSDIARLNRPWLTQTRALWPVLLFLLGAGLYWRRREIASSRQREALRTIYNLGEEILSAASTAEILNKLAVVAPKVLRATGVGLYVFDRGENTLNPVAEALARSFPCDAPAGLIQSSIATCFANRTLFVIPDTRHHPFHVAAAGADPSQRLPRSILFVPMLAQGEPIGVLQVQNDRRSRTFSGDEQAVAQYLANQMGLAVKLLQQRSFREQLSRSEKLAAVGRLISGVVNDLQTPLEAISSMADSALEQHTGSAPGHELLVIASEARRATAIVNRLVSFAKPEHTEPEPVELNVLLRNLIQFREHEWKACGIQLRNLTKDKPLYALGSQGQLEQVFLNLFVHAEQSLEEALEKRITVRADKLANRVFIEIGYTAPLRRASASEAPAEGGALGLELCRSIVAGHGGELRISSASQESKFEVELPLVSLEELAAENASSAPAVPARRWTALLLEPEEFVERTLVEWLSNRGYRVVPVRSSEEGLDLVQRVRFDVVFCSTHLTGLNWVEFFDRVRGRVSAFALLARSLQPGPFHAFQRGGPLRAAKTDRAEPVRPDHRGN